MLLLCSPFCPGQTFPQGKVPKEGADVPREETGRGETGDQTSWIVHIPWNEAVNNFLVPAKCSKIPVVYICVYTYMYTYT